MDFLIFALFFSSEPTYKDDLITGFTSIQGNDILFLDVTNDGLRLDKNPEKDAVEWWANLEQQAKEMFDTYKKKVK